MIYLLAISALTLFSSTFTMKEFGPLTGLSGRSLCAFSLKKNRWQQVRVQFDERNESGDFVLNGGDPYTANSDDGMIDDNDEISFLIEDFGDTISVKKKSYPSHSRDFYRLKVKGVGDILLARVCKKVKFSPVAKYQDGEIVTPLYKYVFDRKSPISFGNLFLHSNKKWHQIFSKSHYEVRFILPWYLPNFKFDDTNLVSQIESWKIGPIRSIIALGVKMKGFLSLFKLHLFSELVFSPTSFQVPTIIESPIDLNKYLKRGSGLYYAIDVSKDLEWSLDTNIPRVSSVGKELDNKKESPFYWARASSTVGSATLGVRVDSKLRSNAPQYFRRGDPVELDWAKGFDVGIHVDGSHVGKGKYDFGLDLYMQDASENKNADLMNQYKYDVTQLN